MFALLCGFALYTWIVASSSSLLVAEGQEGAQLQLKLEELAGFMKRRRISKPLRRRVLSYYRYLFANRSGTQRELGEFFEELPSQLAIDVQMSLHRRLIRKVPLFQRCGEDCVRRLVQMLKFEVFLPGDWIVRQGEEGDEMFFLNNGTAEVWVNVESSGIPGSGRGGRDGRSGGGEDEGDEGDEGGAGDGGGWHTPVLRDDPRDETKGRQEEHAYDRDSRDEEGRRMGEGVGEDEAREGTPVATPIKTPGRFPQQGTSSITPLGASPVPTTPLYASNTPQGPHGETPYGSDTHTSGGDGGGQFTSGCGDGSDRNDGGCRREPYSMANDGTILGSHSNGRDRQHDRQQATRVMVKRLVSGHFFGGEEEREEHIVL